MFNLKALFLVALAGFAACGAEAKKDWKSRKPKNFIMVIPDGFGPASELMARDYINWTNNKTTTLPIDDFVIGQIRTRSSDSYVTDSSASASAYSIGIKTKNGYVGIDENLQVYGTVLEAAHLQGYKTGLVVTSRITHATPASYASHTYFRDLESDIAAQIMGHAHPLGSTVDVILGGGRCYFTPKSGAKKSCRTDELDLLDLSKQRGYTVFSDRKTFDGKLKTPYIGLFTDDHMSYEIDRDPKAEPSLAEMAIKALDSLADATKNSKKGFFVMVEASRIDHAGHANDAVGHLHDILAYNEAMEAIVAWIDKHEHDSPSVMVSTADHECGGLTVGGEMPKEPGYWYAPQFFAGASGTNGVLAKKWASHNGTDKESYLKTEIFAKYGVPDPTPAEIKSALELQAQSSKMATLLGTAIADRLRVKWATGGHTGVDVTLYGYGPGSEEWVGNHENVEVAGWVRDTLGLDLKAVDRKLRANETWLKEWVLPKGGVVLEKRDLTKHHH